MSPLNRPFLVLATSLLAVSQGTAQDSAANPTGQPPAPAVAQFDLGLPALPPVTADSPRDNLLFADRFEYSQDDSDERYAGMAPPTMFDGLLTPAQTGTGFPEIFKYQLGNSYDEFGTPHPLVIAYHGFGGSANSVGIQSMIDEECELRGWIYMAPTGIDDKLFGSPISQQNTYAAVEWMVDNFNIDPDRIYMVGLSMGGGVSANFTARHRDPDGIMIAAIGLVSATLDWTMEYNIGFPALHDWMSNEYNFDGSPTEEPFKYKQASAAYFTEGTYPPLPGTIDPDLSMVVNFADTPAYITYDTLDPLVQVPPVNAALDVFLRSLGFVSQDSIKTGTTNPDNGEPAAHSWLVLDEEELFDFFDTHTVIRNPDAFTALMDIDSTVSWLEAEQLFTGEFSYVEADRDIGSSTLWIDDVVNVKIAQFSGTDTQLTALPTVHASSGDIRGFQLRMLDLVSTPSYLLDASTSDILTGTSYLPVNSAIMATVPALTSIEFDIVNDPEWNSLLVSAPNPVAIGTSSTVILDGPAGATTGWLFVGASETLATVKGSTVGIDLAPPGFLLPALPLSNGDLSFPVTIDNDPLLIGLRLPMQYVLTDGGSIATSLSNIWGFEIE